MQMLSLITTFELAYSKISIKIRKGGYDLMINFIALLDETWRKHKWLSPKYERDRISNNLRFLDEKINDFVKRWKQFGNDVPNAIKDEGLAIWYELSDLRDNVEQERQRTNTSFNTIINRSTSSRIKSISGDFEGSDMLKELKKRGIMQ
jgi:hypothetical protein